MERYHIYKLGIAILFYAIYCRRPMVNGLKVDVAVNDANKTSSGEDYYVYYQGVQGKPGVDFPVHSRIPRTSFSCKEVESGYYADLETDCQVFHICNEGTKVSFLCPNGTIFQQSDLICDWWFKVNCTNSPNLYVESAEQLRESNIRRKASRRVFQNDGKIPDMKEFLVAEYNTYSGYNNKGQINNSGNNKNSNNRGTTFNVNGSRGKVTDKVSDHSNTNNNRNRINNNRGSTVNHSNNNRVSNSGTGNHNNNIGNSAGTNHKNSNSNSPSANSNNGYNSNTNRGSVRSYSNTNSNRKAKVVENNKNTNSYSNTDETISNVNNYGNNNRVTSNNYSNSRVTSNSYSSTNGVNSSGNYFNKTPTPSPLISNREHVHNVNNNFNYNPTISPTHSTTTSSNYQNNYNYKATSDGNVNNKVTSPDNFNNYNNEGSKNDYKNSNAEISQENNNYNTNYKTSVKVTSPTNSFNSNDNYKATSPVGNSYNNYDTKSTANGNTYTTPSSNSDAILNNNRQGKSFDSNVNKPTTGSSYNTHGSYGNSVTYGYYNKGSTTGNNGHDNHSNINKQINDDVGKTFSNTNDHSKSNNYDAGNSNYNSGSTSNNYNTGNSNTYDNNNGNSNTNYNGDKSGSNNFNNDYNKASTTSSTQDAHSNTQGNLQGNVNSYGRYDKQFSERKMDVSEEMQVVAETAGFYGSNLNKISTVEKEKTTNPYPNHRTTYSELKHYTNLPVVSTSATPRSTINNGKPFVVSTPKLGVYTTERSTFKYSPTVPTVTPSYSKTTFGNRVETFTNPPSVANGKSTTLRKQKNKNSFTIGLNSLQGAIAVKTQSVTTTSKPPRDKGVIRLSLSSDGGAKSVNNANSNSFGRTSVAPSNNNGYSTSGSVTVGRSNHLQSASYSNVGYTQSSEFSSSSSTRSHYNTQTTASVNYDSRSSVGQTQTPSPSVSTQQSNIGHNNYNQQSSGNSDYSNHQSTASNFNTNYNNQQQTNDNQQSNGYNNQQSNNYNNQQTGVYNNQQSNSFNNQQTSDAAHSISTPEVKPTTYDPNYERYDHLGVEKTNTYSGAVSDAVLSLSAGLQPPDNNEREKATTERYDYGETVTAGQPTQSTIRPGVEHVNSLVSSVQPPLPTNSDYTSSHREGRYSSTTTPSPRRGKSGFYVTNTFRPEEFITSEFQSGSITGSKNTYIPTTYTSTTTEYVSNTFGFVKPTGKPKPKPFEPAPTTEKPFLTTADYDELYDLEYQISSASPFTNVPPTLPSSYHTSGYEVTTRKVVKEHVDNMLDTLKEIGSVNPRPGLIVPPSVGPQTLHTLAVYFANALDNLVPEEGKTEQPVSEDTVINSLLSKKTVDGYNELFMKGEKEEEGGDGGEREDEGEVEDDDNDLNTEHSSNPVQSPRVRQLAKVFTQALSSYLDDPDMFRKVLQQIRPTEPPPIATDNPEEDELLNFSDADIKPELPRLPTPPPANPTWGYILAFNNSNNNHLEENLQTADTQSFVPGYNDVRTHWTQSPEVTKLWRNTLSIDPLALNENLENLENPTVNYELHTLPKIQLNSTQVHGLLINFMNSTEDSVRLKRILDKLNTTQGEFLEKMKQIEENPLTRRLILLLVSECASNSTSDTVHDILSLANSNTSKESLQSSSTNWEAVAQKSNLTLDNKPAAFSKLIDSELKEEDQDARALQLLNSLYSIASKYGK